MVVPRKTELRREYGQAKNEADNFIVSNDRDICRQAYKRASYMSKKIAHSSNYFDAFAEEAVPRLERREILLGKKLGRGGFNDVFEVRDIRLLSSAQVKVSPHSQVLSSQHQEKFRDIISRHVVRRNNSHRFAIKFLSRESMLRQEKFTTGAMDLVVEAKFLSSINHPNIVKLHGLPAADTKGFLDGTFGGYFLLIDRLCETLDQKITSWEEEKNSAASDVASPPQSRIGRFSSNRGFGRTTKALSPREKISMAKRISVAYEISSALAYLHSKGIIFRDLKPENVGFDAHGVVKIFDFGLAKELDPKERVNREDYAMTAGTGSLRYMAPEVALSKPYGLSADVYSFSILLWEMCSLEVPYATMNVEDHREFAMIRDVRPSLPTSWPCSLRTFIKRMWSRDSTGRPSMRIVMKSLKKEIAILSEDRDSTSGFFAESRRALSPASRSAASFAEPRATAQAA